MKTIIVCTDFSPIATNAVQYAAALAKVVKARLVLYHYFNYPIPASDLQGIFPAVAPNKVTDGLERRLKDIKTSLVSTYQIEVECVVRSLDFSIDLEGLFHSEKANLVVIGKHGQSAVVNTLVGSVASNAIRRGKLPLLVVPQGVVFHPFKKILFPCDDHEILHAETLRALRDMAVAFDAYIEVLTLFDLEKTPALAPQGKLSPAKNNLEIRLDGTRHGYSFENEEFVDRGILDEATRSAADLVAMIPHHHSLWSNLLNQSKTQQIAAAISVPLLVLGERES